MSVISKIDWLLRSVIMHIPIGRTGVDEGLGG